MAMTSCTNSPSVASRRQTSDDAYCIGLEDVLEASKRIQGHAHYTPVLRSSSFNTAAHSFFFKVEAWQRTGSFKFRGALNAIQSLTSYDADDNDCNKTIRRHVVAHSSGNHAQAVALAAQLTCNDATIVMPRNAPMIKQTAVRNFGGHIVLVDNTNEARENEADRIVASSNRNPHTACCCFVHPSEDPHVIAGQGTVCLELVAQMKELIHCEPDAVIIPVGGGGLAAGNAVALRGLLGHNVKIVLAEPARLDDAKRSFEAGRLLQHHPDNTLDSVADGLKTTLGPNTWPIVRDLVDDILTVSEEEILRATKKVWERLKVCVEPSAGVGVAVAMSDEFQDKYGGGSIRHVGVILCGGNVDMIETAKRMEAIGV